MGHQQIQESRVLKIKTKNTFIKLIFTILWAMFLLVATLAESLEQLLEFKSLGFKWVSQPDFLSFFYFHDLPIIHPEFTKVKLGHFIGFAVMDLLLFNLIKKHKYSIGISVLLAFLTEILQLFFGRDGRLYDIIVDTSGILTAYFIYKTAKK